MPTERARILSALREILTVRHRGPVRISRDWLHEKNQAFAGLTPDQAIDQRPELLWQYIRMLGG